MFFRSTSFAISSRAIQFSALHNSAILKYQEQISSGQKFQRPSEDPIAFRQITNLTSRLSELNADSVSLNGAKALLNTSFVQLEELGNVTTRAVSIAQQGVQALSDDERQTFALEIDGLLSRVQSLAQTEFAGVYLYGGTRSNEVPFEFADPAVEGGPLSVTYRGTEDNGRAFVGEAVSVDTIYDGTSVFGGGERGESLILGNLQVKNGSGTDTLIGRAELKIFHDETIYAPGSGIQPGSRSALEDTVIGQSGTNVITIVDTSGDGSSGTIALNNGEPQPFSNSDTNLKVVSSTGEYVFVDTSSITPGFNGSIDIEATGSLSVDGGKSRTPIDFSENQVVSDSETGRFVTLDTRDITEAGSASLEFPGTSDVFQVLYGLAQDLRNERGLNGPESSAAIGRRLDELAFVSDQAFGILGEQSTSLQTLESLEFRIEDLQVSVETQLSDIQSTDIPEAVVRLENSQALLQYTYAVTAQISNLGLLEFLR
jgi:flagellar hook-associated protein 3